MNRDVKHQPAMLTPLPWEAHAVNNGAGSGVGAAGAPITAHGLALGRVWESSSDPRARQNADYLVRAANAYPKLVEALREAHLALAQHWFYGDGEESYNNDEVIAADKACTALLCDLGEAS